MAYQPPHDSELEQFLGAYLHQDFKDLYGDAWAAVQAYVDNEPLGSRITARAELNDLLRQCHSEKELSDAVAKVGMDYHPPGLGGTYRGFLEGVEEYLLEHES